MSSSFKASIVIGFEVIEDDFFDAARIDWVCSKNHIAEDKDWEYCPRCGEKFSSRTSYNKNNKSILFSTKWCNQDRFDSWSELIDLCEGSVNGVFRVGSGSDRGKFVCGHQTVRLYCGGHDFAEDSAHVTIHRIKAIFDEVVFMRNELGFSDRPVELWLIDRVVMVS